MTRVDDRLVVVSLLTAVVALAVCPLLIRGTPPLLADAAIPWWGMVIPFALGTGIELKFRFQQSVLFATVIEVPYVIGLFTMSGAGLVVAHVAGAVLALAVLRYRPPILLFNVTGTALDCGIAIFVFRHLVDAGSALHLQGWAASASAMVLCAVIGSSRALVLRAIRGRRVVDREWFAATRVAMVVAAVNSGLAFVALRLVVSDPRLVWLVGGLVVFVVVGYRNYISLLNHHEGLNRLYESTGALELAAEHDGSVRTMLDQVVELLAAERADLSLLASASGAPRFFRADHDRPGHEVVDPSDEAVAEALDRAARRDGADASSGVELATDRSMVARLQGSRGLIGVIEVSTYSGMTFSEGDRRLFEMFVNHASVALQNSQLVDELRHEVGQREHEALHDALTALPNRVMFDLHTRRALAGRAVGEIVAVALIDIDRFKEVNDTLGHHHGDVLLTELARRLDALAAERDLVVARLGGDEFAVLMTGLGSVDLIAETAAAVKATLEESVEIANVRVDINTSVGISVFDEDAEMVDGSTLLRQADVAMYIAKGQHRGIVFYDRADDPYSPKRLSLAADLRHAVDRGEIEAYFQPEIDLVTGDVISVEALARWTHAEHGNIVPDQFIPIAEQSGLIRDLTYLMLEQSLERIRQWRSHGFDLHVAVNLSVRCLTDEHLVERVMRQLELAGLGAESLTLEVTEGTIMADPEHAMSVLGRLHEQGIRLSIDDFGMGYSSLAQLKRMPVGQLKVDRSFVTYVSEDHDDAAIVKSVTDLGHNLGLEVIAEGVEDQPTLDKLIELGCDSVQGFYLARPMSADQTLRWLRERERQRSEPGYDPKFAITQIV